ncbi:uncharacterized protein METZ01_LOCUS138415 [marine metagenome]|uniref:Uncharacterized protein n=1 Tax=marine metagenome TaxID=408172 RepID=A0A381Z9B8_9ZZZZ
MFCGAYNSLETDIVLARRRCLDSPAPDAPFVRREAP